MRILVIDDDVELASLLGEFLRREGFEPDFAHDGLTGLNAALNGGYALIVLDVMLPDINGKEVCQRVRSDPTMDDVKIICISGMVEQDRIDDLKAAGANDFLQKPFEVDTLLARVCALLDMETLSAR